MSLRKKSIETISVGAVRSSIEMTDHLDQYIPDNDKEPCWDGSVYLYKNKSHNKENFEGRMPVQVKGVLNDNLSMPEITYPISIKDLKNYLIDGGIIYFVVYIGNGGTDTKIYYIELTPIKIRIILDSAKKNKSTKSITLKEFPSDNNQKVNIFFNCFQNCQKQSSFTEAKLYTLEELENQGLLEGITIPLRGVNIDKDPQLALTNNEVYFYAKIKGSTIPQPLYLIPDQFETQETVKTNIIIEDRIYYSEIKVLKNSTCTKITIGESFFITIFKNEDQIKISYTSSDKLHVLINDLEFMLNYIKFGYFKSNDNIFPFDYKNADFSNFDIDKQTTFLEIAKNTAKSLSIIGCKKELILKDFTDNDIRNMQLLNTAILKNPIIADLRDDLPFAKIMRICNLNILLSFYPEKNKKGTFTVKNFFSTDFFATYKNNKGKTYPTSVFAFLKNDDLIAIDNIDFEVFLTSFKKIELHEETFTRANLFMLELLLAFDKTQNINFLNTAKEFDKWIQAETNDELSYEIKTLNHFQIVKRYRELTNEEKKDLYNIIATPNIDNSILVGAYLLLDQLIPAKMVFSKMSKDEQNMFMEYPIYRFWKELEENIDGQA